MIAMEAILLKPEYVTVPLMMPRLLNINFCERTQLTYYYSELNISEQLPHWYPSKSAHCKSFITDDIRKNYTFIQTTTLHTSFYVNLFQVGQMDVFCVFCFELKISNLYE